MVPIAALALLTVDARAQGPTSPTSSPAGAAPAASPPITPSLWIRARAERWNWFDAPENDDYAFLGAIVRLGVSGRHPAVQWTVEGAVPILAGLPEDAIGPAPRGQLGFGGSYWAANERNGASLILKQAFVRVGRPVAQGGHALRAGRFEFADGVEMAAADPTVATLKRDRIGQRLIGPFGWTHVGRSFDGAHYSWDRGGARPRNVTLVAAAPTEGALQLKAQHALDVGVAYAAANAGATRDGGGTDARLFALEYRDWRDLAPVDNRPAAERTADATRGVRVTTLGGNVVHAARTSAGTVDAMAWGAVQTGRWGALDHRAHAVALEAGIQPPLLAAVRPWLRVTYFRGSGDADAADGRHGAFFEVLPTPRPYARFPIHNLMNVEDLGATLILRPGTRVTVRTDAHALRLADAADLWYMGAGAVQNHTFGYVGRPSGGARSLATLLDVSTDVRLTRQVGVNLYLAHAAGKGVIEADYPGSRPAWLGYVELEVRR